MKDFKLGGILQTEITVTLVQILCGFSNTFQIWIYIEKKRMYFLVA